MFDERLTPMPSGLNLQQPQTFQRKHVLVLLTFEVLNVRLVSVRSFSTIPSPGRVVSGWRHLPLSLPLDSLEIFEGVVVVFFGVILRSMTWRNVSYLAVAFPSGLFYFVFLTTGFSLGLGLIITLVGIPLLVGMLAASHGLGEFERLLTNQILDTSVEHPERLSNTHGLWEKTKVLVVSSETWKRVLYLMLKFPFGTLSLVLLIITLSMFAQIAAPLVYQQDWYSETAVVWPVDALWKAFTIAIVGILVGLGLLHTTNGFARIWGLVANTLLGPTAATPDSPTLGRPDPRLDLNDR